MSYQLVADYVLIDAQKSPLSCLELSMIGMGSCNDP